LTQEDFRGPVVAIMSGYNDEQFVLFLTQLIDWSVIREIIFDYYKRQGYVYVKDWHIGNSVDARVFRGDTSWNNVFCTIEDDMIIVSRRSYGF
jgi:hypothetical protein